MEWWSDGVVEWWTGLDGTKIRAVWDGFFVRVRYYTGLRPGGTLAYRLSCAKAEGPPLPN
ncbi:MAG: hypothetical protein QOI53_3319 [Verrucomicrobiota bacterium]|nr:hypothetical protein [Verrucomicrobiota bacterium]